MTTAVELSQDLLSDDFVKRTVGLLVEHYRPEKIYLFGSRARGEGKSDSDYDFLVLVRERPSKAQQAALYRKRAERKLFRPTDVIVWTKAYFEEMSQVQTSMPATILREGVLVYAA